MPKKPVDCPGVGTYESGYGKRVEFWAGTEGAAMAGLAALLPGAKADAEARMAKARKAAEADGNAACKAGKGDCPRCTALPVEISPTLWTAVGSVSPYNKWLARGGYEWTVVVICECES